MRKMIVAIDFSKCSLHALQYAVMIANKLKADITMVWVNKPENYEVMYPGLQKKLHDTAIENFEEIINKLKYGKLPQKNKYKGELLKGELDYKIRDGVVYREVVNQAKYDDAYMIILGTHGASGFEEFWIGSNAKKIVSAAPCPTLTIREGVCTKTPVGKIVFPIDNTLSTRHKVPFTTEFAKSIKAEIHVLKLLSSFDDLNKKVESYSRQVIDSFIKSKTKYTVASIDSDDDEDIIQYAKKMKANMMAVVTDEKSVIENIWMSPFAKKIVRISPIPVLHIHPKETYEAFFK